MPEYSAAFQRAVALILKHEGGYTLRENDPGNWTGGKVGQGELRGTNMGIAAHSYPTEDIKGMTIARATAIYHRDYWLAVRGDDLPPAIALPVFDMAVNAGPGAAVKCLQRALGVDADGKLGPITLANAKAADTKALAIRVTRERVLYYAALANWSTERKGWTQRTLETLVAAVTA